jgi:hypothetical protein
MRLIPVLAAAAVVACSVAALAAPTPKPAAKPPAGPTPFDVTKVQPRALAPKRQLHVEYTVEVNKLGQVARVRSVKPSHDEDFDTKTYGNALQMFIRTPDGRALAGIYRVSYDYDPKKLTVDRTIALVRAGGVNPNAKGAALDMMEIARRNQHRTPPPGLYVTPGPIPSVNIRRMPDLPQVMKSPSPH